MSQETGIEWATHTASPWFGCSKVSPGCTNCYAEELTLQRGWAGWGDNSPRVRSKGFWKDTYRYNKKAEGLIGLDRPRMFTSLMDWLDPKAPIEWLYDFVGVIHDCQNLDWLLLTKRPELFNPRFRLLLDLCWKKAKDNKIHIGKIPHYDFIANWQCRETSPKNVWFGVTCEDQQQLAKRWDSLREIPARIKWASVEPLLEHVQLEGPRGGLEYHYLTRLIPNHSTSQGFDWIVVGGESGKNRRDCGVDAICSVAYQCLNAGTPVFVKQDCAARPGQQGRLPADVWALKQYPHANLRS